MPDWSAWSTTRRTWGGAAMPMIQTPRWATCSSLEKATTFMPPWFTSGAKAVADVP